MAGSDGTRTPSIRSIAARPASRSIRSTRRRRPSAARCTSVTSSHTPTPTSLPAFSGCAAAKCSIRWDGTTTACRPSDACRTTTACGAIRRCPYDPSISPPPEPPKQPISISRPNFIELCERLTKEDEKAFEHLWRYLGLSVDWSMTYATIDKRSQRVSQIGFLHLLEEGPCVSARGADAVGRGLSHGRGAGRARRSRARRRVSSPAVRSAGRRSGRDRNDAPRIAAGLRRARRSSGRRAIQAALRERRADAALPGPRAGAARTSLPIPKRAPASP